jgi:hypothetical protein
MYNIHESDNNIGIVLIISVALSDVPIAVHQSLLLAGPMMPLLLLPLFRWVSILLPSVLVAVQVITGIVGQHQAVMVQNFMHLDNNIGL